MSKRERYKELFKQSKAIVKDWESVFLIKNDRKPNREDMASAPEKVLVAYKNCKKIKLFFEKESKSNPDENSKSFDEESSPNTNKSETVNFSGLFPKSDSKNSSKEILNTKVWGEHLNKKSMPSPLTTNHMFIGKLDFSVDKNSTRSSMKKKNRLEKKSLSFFGSLGDESTLLGDLSQSSFLDDAQTGNSLPASPSHERLDSSVVATKLDQSDDSKSIDLLPETHKVRAFTKAKNDRNPVKVFERTIDSSWLARCTDDKPQVADLAKPSSSSGIALLIPEQRILGNTEDQDVSSACEDDKQIFAKTPHKDDRVPRLLSYSSTPTNFKGLFSPVKKTDFKATSEVIRIKNPPSQEVETKYIEGVAKANKRKRVLSPEEKSNSKTKQNSKKIKIDSNDLDDFESQKSKNIKKVTKKSKQDEDHDQQVAGPSDVNLFELGFEDSEKGNINSSQGNRTFMTQERRLAINVESGKANENYRKIDLKKKTYSKGRGRGKFLMKLEYQKKLAAKEGKPIKEFKCYRCGESGHFASRCTGSAGDILIPQDVVEELVPDSFPTLEEVKEKAGLVNHSEMGVDDPHSVDLTQGNDQLLEIVKTMELQTQANQLDLTTEPFFIDDTFDKDAIFSALKKFGYNSFRPGQEEGITRILKGESSLVLLSTGSGKSLIYQLPAYLYGEKKGCITIVVSPLVSLMEDQVTGLPSFLKAAALHYNLTPKAKEKVIEQVKSKKLHFLLVSPESVAGGGGAFGSLIPHLPPIAFVCIDEAHCVSQWSHNFRPSYLRLSKVIREKLKVKTILGLTATAPERMIHSVADQLGVPSQGIIRGPLLPNNLTLTVSRDEEREMALLALLSEGGALAQCESVIVYCTRRDDCVKVASFLRTKLQEREYQLSKLGNNRLRYSATAEPYHAGLTPSRRKSVQNHFMSGKLRVVVATVAFGMGIDKSDIRAIVHYNMPKTFESYIQEIGRAGRDGAPARCHLFLESEGKDLSELKRHIYANSMDRFTIRKLLHAVFDISEETPRTIYKERALSVAETVEALDLPEENISTILCYLESGLAENFVKLCNPVYATCKVQCYGGPNQLMVTAASCPPLAAAIAIQRQKGIQVTGLSSIEFPVVDISAEMGWNSAVVKKELKNLEWKSTSTGWKKTGIMVEFSNLSFHLEARTGITEELLDQLQDQLYERSRNQEFSELSNLLRLHRAFKLVSYRDHFEATESDMHEQSDKLKQFISSYFTEAEVVLEEVKKVPAEYKDEQIIRDRVRNFVLSNCDNNWNGRAVARIFHGIQSPNFSAKVWGRSPAWRIALYVDFNLLVRLATEEIIRIRSGK